MSVADVLRARLSESYEMVKGYTDSITHQESTKSPIAGHNSMHWIVGHIVVSRCNFLMLLDIPPIWEWATCEHFIPGSKPSAAAAEHIDFATLFVDLDRTQESLLAALECVEAADLDVIRDGQPIEDHLAVYVAHEADHADQLMVVHRALKGD